MLDSRFHFRTYVWLLLPLALSNCTHICNTAFTHTLRPSGYQWKQSRAPGTSDTVYYATDPSTGWTLYVGPDNVYYTYQHRGSISSSDLSSKWCPHDTIQQSDPSGFMKVFFKQVMWQISAAIAHHNRLSDFNYTHRPAGYQWKARISSETGAIVYYGINPSTRWTVYVGPDNVYYTFSHPGEIQSGDLQSVWDPHDAVSDRPLWQAPLSQSGTR